MRPKLSVVIALSLIWSAVARAGTILVTPQEAALPPAPKAATLALTNRGLTRGPHIAVLGPDGSVSGPFELKLAFKAHGGSKINLDTVKLLYLKTPTVDLTTRIRPFVSSHGIDVQQTEVPPGRHTFKIAILDTDGREATAVFTIDVLN